MNKRGSGNEILNYFILRILFLTVIFVIVVMFAQSLHSIEFDTSDLREEIFVNRLLSSPTALAYLDETTNRVHPRTIDRSKFSDEKIDQAFSLGESKTAARLELVNLKTNNRVEIFLNKKWYDRLRPLSTYDNYEKSIRRESVQIYDQGQIAEGLLRIDTVRVNG